MIVAVGLDIVQTERIEGLLRRYGARLVKRILGPEEHRIFLERTDAVSFLAGRFAAKESFFKAMAGILTQRPPWRQVQILPGPHNQPVYRFHEEIAARLDGLITLVSISHERSLAAAVTVVERID